MEGPLDPTLDIFGLLIMIPKNLALSWHRQKVIFPFILLFIAYGKC